MERLRGRLEELQDAKQQLATETASHAKTYTTMVALEAEVEALKKNKHLVDQYRDRLTELVIERDDLSRRITDSDALVAQLREEVASLSAGQHQRLSDARTLTEELIALQEQVRELEKGRGIGEGITELNPEIRQEIDKLRSENKQLKDRLQMTSLEAVEQMEAQLADQRSIAGSLQGKWADTKTQLQEAKQTILLRETDIQNLQVEIGRLSQRLQATIEKADRDATATKAEHMNEIGAVEKRWRSNLAFQRISSLLIQHDLAQSCSQLQQSLFDANQSLIEVTQVRDRLDQELNVVRNDLSAARKAQICITLERDESLAAQSLSHEQALKKLQADFLAEKRSMQSSFHATLSAETNRLAQLQADLEEESMKRRKAERAKKFFEVEAQRHKTQLQVATAAGATAGQDATVGRDIDSVLKELKSMQQELNEANREISYLRSRGNCNLTANNSASEAVAKECSTEEKRSDSNAELISRGSNSSFHGNFNSAAGSSLKGPSRILRPIHGASNVAKIWSDGDGEDHSHPQQNFLEQAELSDKRIDLLTREKREMISKTLEENKEKMELTQKLLLSEKEVAALRAELRKTTLEKERAERKLLMQASENVAPRINANARLFSQI